MRPGNAVLQVGPSSQALASCSRGFATNSTDIFNIVSIHACTSDAFLSCGFARAHDALIQMLSCCLQHRHTESNNLNTTFDFTPENYERVSWENPHPSIFEH